MKEIEQLYRKAPVKNSPDTLDRAILRQAELHAAANAPKTARPLLSSWMPVAASCLVVVLGVTLILRSGMVGTGGGISSQPDGYPETLSESGDSSQSPHSMADRSVADRSVADRSVADEDQISAIANSNLTGLTITDAAQSNESTSINSEAADTALENAVVSKEKALARKSQAAEKNQRDALVAQAQLRKNQLQQKIQGRAAEVSTPAPVQQSMQQTGPMNVTSPATVSAEEMSVASEFPPVRLSISGDRPAATVQLAQVNSVSDSDAAEVAEAARPMTDAATDRIVAAEPVAESVVVEISQVQTVDSVVGESAVDVLGPDSVKIESDLAAMAEQHDSDSAVSRLPQNTQATTEANSDIRADVNSYYGADDQVARSSSLGRESSAETNTRRDTIILVGNGSLDWLSEQSKSSYTLQLATADDEAYLTEFAQNLELVLPPNPQFSVLPLRSTNAGSPRFYTLLLGVFDTFEEAENERNRLPSQAKRFDPRVRNFGILQEGTE